MDVGVKTMPAVQLAPGARTAVQVFCVRLNGGVTVRTKSVAPIAAVLVTTAVWGAVATPRMGCRNEIWTGEIVIPETACPTPLSDT